MAVSGCREVGELLFDYLEGNLDNRIKSKVEAHLELCAECRAELERCRSTLALLAGAKMEPPGDFTASVMARIAADGTGENVGGAKADAGSSGTDYEKVLKPAKRPFRFRYGTVAAAVLLVTVAAVAWRVLPALMPAGMSKSDSAELNYTSLAGGMDDADASETEAAAGEITEDMTAAETCENERTQILTLMPPTEMPAESPADGEETGTAEPGDGDNGSSSGTGGGETGATSEDTEGTADMQSECFPATDKYGACSLSADDLLAQYAPEFIGKASEVILIYTGSPISARPYASARIGGEGYAAFLIDENEACVTAAETLAAELEAEVCGARESGGVVWIEIYS